MDPTKEEAAQRLANWHYATDDDITHIFRLTAPNETTPGEPIKLLEVSTITPSSGIMPLAFGPSAASGVPYRSVIIEVTPAEYDQIRADKLPLPEGWVITGDALPRHH